MALEWNQFLAVRNPYAGVVEFTLTEYVIVGSNATVPVSYFALQHGKMFRTQFRIEAYRLGLHAIRPYRKRQSLVEIAHIIEMLQYKMKQELGKQ